jgi:hypothetical protein
VKSLTYSLSALALVVLVGCSSGVPGGPAIGPEGTRDAASAQLAAVEALLADFEGDPAVAAMMSEQGMATLDGFAPTGAVMRSGIVTGLETGSLPRGVYVWNELTLAFDEVAADDDLVFHWTTEDAEAAELRFDWSANGPITVVDGSEVPTGMNVTLSLDGAIVGDVDVSAAFSETCDDLRRVTVDGFAGADTRLTAEAVTVGLDDTSFDTSGRITVSSGGDHASVHWDVDVKGTFYEACDYAMEPTVDEGTVAFGTTTSFGGSETSFDFGLAFGNVVMTPEGSATFDVDGSVKVNGASAVTFTGTVDDAFVGDGVVLTFADGEIMTLEAFIASLDAAATVLRSAALLLR